ncbi:MAG: hypothetical protein NVSMB68_08700 [Thermoanaerobaculia bacterium]
MRKGPRPDLCLELWRERGYLAVLGNNEQKLLSWARQRWRRWIAPREDRSVIRRRDLIEYIQTWPVAIDVPSVNATVVHGGFFPNTRINAEDVARNREDLIRLRYLRRSEDGWQRVVKGKVTDSDLLWPEVWPGGRVVLYGHTPLPKVRVDDHAIGLDTGCVYGGELSAAIYERGSWRFEAVGARRAYARR